jgi:wyosine [tRNA(Phe)-imidazoG37] synthetase (radical SAM superfamily)
VTISKAYRQHSRRFDDFKFVYPVISRRSRGISIGINTNPDKVCNFDCIYCQVDRNAVTTVEKFDLAIAEQELRAMLEIVQSGELAQYSPFNSVPRDMLRLNDVALSGDAEPTTLQNFSAVIEMIAQVKPRPAKIVLITNATGLDRADVKRGLAIMDANDGEVWVKLDAGTEEYFRLINRTKVPFAQILDNITAMAKERPIIIQSLFLNLRGSGPSAEEIGAYCARLREIVGAGGCIQRVQICTLARKPMGIVDGDPASKLVAPLANADVDAIARRVREETGLNVESFYGA